jgi:hypothetical protein
MTLVQKEPWRNPVRARLDAGEIVIGATVTTSNIESAAHEATLGFSLSMGGNGAFSAHSESLARDCAADSRIAGDSFRAGAGR